MLSRQQCVYEARRLGGYALAMRGDVCVRWWIGLARALAQDGLFGGESREVVRLEGTCVPSARNNTAIENVRNESAAAGADTCLLWTRAGAMVLVAVVCGCPLMPDARVFGGKGEDTFSRSQNARPLSETEMITYLAAVLTLNSHTRKVLYTNESSRDE